MTEINLNQVKPLTYKVNDLNHVEIGGIDLTDLAKEYGTPLYVTCEETIRQRARAYEQAFKNHYSNHLTLFASKSFNCQAICNIMQEEGLGLDVVSGGELYTALSINFPAEKIVLHGNNKLYDELQMAISNEIGAIIVDNFYEIGLIEDILANDDYQKSSKEKQEVNVLIRVTPGIECHTHEYIKTGKLDSKFGFNIEELDQVLERLLELKTKFAAKVNFNINGLHAHIGSQIFETVPHQDTVKVLVNLYSEIKDKFKLEFKDLNVGGGLGIKYTEEDDPPSIDFWLGEIAKTLKEECANKKIQEPRLLIEPGRSLVGPAGVTIYKVGNIKNIEGIRKYVSVDGGMADNVRPIMYQAEYHSEVANKANSGDHEKVTIAGRYCESGDILIKDTKLPKVEAGDIIAIFSTGAYNYSMASNYNRITRPAVVLVNQGKSEIIVERETLDDLIRLDRMPSK